MIRAVIIEDEAPARDRLLAALHEVADDIEVVATLTSVAESLAWIRRHEAPDLVFADIALADGSSFEIFESTAPTYPVIFCTAYDRHTLEAFERNGIAYLLKPYGTDQLGAAIDRYRRLALHFHRDTQPSNLRSLVRELANDRQPRRLLAREHDRFVAFAVADLAYVEVGDAATELVHVDGRRATVDRSLAELETELPSREFFRINRRVLARASAIASFRPYFKGRLLVELSPPANAEVVVSQPNTAKFRAWLAGG